MSTDDKKRKLDEKVLELEREANRHNVKVALIHSREDFARERTLVAEAQKLADLKGLQAEHSLRQVHQKTSELAHADSVIRDLKAENEELKKAMRVKELVLKDLLPSVTRPPGHVQQATAKSAENLIQVQAQNAKLQELLSLSNRNNEMLLGDLRASMTKVTELEQERDKMQFKLMQLGRKAQDHANSMKDEFHEIAGLPPPVHRSDAMSMANMK